MAEDERRPSYDELIRDRDKLRTELYRREAEVRALQEMLTFDSLTGLYTTAAHGRTIILGKIKETREQSRNIVLAVLDLKGLGDINNQHDHTTGDQVLVAVTEEIREIAGENGSGVRSHFKGDEFGIFFWGVKKAEVEQRLREVQRVGIRWETAKTEGTVSFTLGLADLGELKGARRMSEGEVLQGLWELADQREREEHRRING